MGRKAFRLCVVIFLVFLVGCGQRQSINDVGETASIERDTDIYKAESNQSADADAARECLDYLTGSNGKTLNYYKAADIIMPYEKSKNPDVLYCLGFMHWYTAGLKYDDVLAKDLFEESESKGNYYASIQLGNIYMEGTKNIDRDYEISRDYYRRAILNGLPEGYYGLGKIYANGFGVEKDIDKAYLYFEKVIEEGKDSFFIASSCLEIGKLYSFGEKRDNTGEDDEPEYLKALEWFEKAESSNFMAIDYMAFLYVVLGWGLETGEDKVLELYEKAANAGYIESMKSLGGIYIDGNYVEQDVKKGLEWYEKAAALNDGEAYYKLGQIYDEGKLVEANSKMARDYYEKAEDAGYENYH